MLAHQKRLHTCTKGGVKGTKLLKATPAVCSRSLRQHVIVAALGDRKVTSSSYACV
jgi:hypothetical protein